MPKIIDANRRLQTRYLALSLFALMTGFSGLSAQEAIHGHDGEQQAGMAYLTPEDNGSAQSPINILSGSAIPGEHDITLHYRSSPGHIANLGHTIEAIYDQGSTLEFDGSQYDLQQLHFHTPSEHLVDGITYPMEMHMVHTQSGNPGKYLVIGVLFREGDSNGELSGILDYAPEDAGKVRELPELIVDAGAILNFSNHYFHYEGSLTTPPYSETVTWLVMKDVHTASPEQIALLNILEGNNARHIQELHARVVDSH